MLKKIFNLVAIALIAVPFCVTARVYATDAKIKNQSAESIVVAGGCFWGVQGVFQHTKGVLDATSGYTGGKADTARYEMVSTGETGHAESVKISYDPSQVTLDKLLEVYFSVAHDPTELNYQGPDHGTQYRSAIFYSSPEQKKAIEEKIAALDRKKEFVTKLEPLTQFYPAEEYHQNYLSLHPHQPYIMMYDAPKLATFEKQFPDLYIK